MDIANDLRSRQSLAAAPGNLDPPLLGWQRAFPLLVVASFVMRGSPAR
jgi:hypothetical protein